ncbi:dehydrogenase [Paenibacillus sp. LMG 31461]|uniref:Dehydrogenase n=1 Tax=Paenibacillus plantarum TaxID=2654975 RepID=A0ABX1X3W3_9BACL|nr:dehydrogenase [Paenibacillus plantarum]NOU63086.1 dehydrogenase [Paenibacillus plantarum]
MIIRSKAPLRLGLAGGGTDVSPYCDLYGGCVLNATIDLYAYCTIEVFDDGNLTFVAADLNEEFHTVALPELELDGCLSLHKGVYNRIVKQFRQDQPLSFRMTTYSDAPAGSGLGSSSTMVVAMLKAYVEWLNLPLGEYEIAQLAYDIERIDVGWGGGKQDQYAATFGGFNFIEFYENNRVIVNPLRVKNWIISELESSMILYYTGASRESAKIIDEQVRNTRNNKPSALQATHIVKAEAYAIKECILKGEINKFAEHLGKSWSAKKKMAASITNERIDFIYSTAMNAGALAGKVSGAGGGGFMMFIVDPVKRIQVVHRLNELGGKVFQFHFTKSGTQGWRV